MTESDALYLGFARAYFEFISNKIEDDLIFAQLLQGRARAKRACGDSSYANDLVEAHALFHKTGQADGEISCLLDLATSSLTGNGEKRRLLEGVLALVEDQISYRATAHMFLASIDIDEGNFAAAIDHGQSALLDASELGNEGWQASVRSSVRKWRALRDSNS